MKAAPAVNRYAGMIVASNRRSSGTCGSRSETSKVRTGFSMIVVSFSRPYRRSDAPCHTFARFADDCRRAPLGAGDEGHCR